MTKDELKTYKEDKKVKFIYKLPCTLYQEQFEYVIIGDITTQQRDNIRFFSLDDWFLRMKSGSILPYVCSILPRSGKIKEFLNIYEKPNILSLRKLVTEYIMNPQTASLTENECLQECLWGIQYLTENRVNRIDVFKSNITLLEAIQQFEKIVTPMYHMFLKNKSNT